MDNIGTILNDLSDISESLSVTNTETSATIFFPYKKSYLFPSLYCWAYIQLILSPQLSILIHSSYAEMRAISLTLAL